MDGPPWCAHIRPPPTAAYRLLKLRDGYLKPRPPADDGSYTSLVMALAVDGESERSVVVSAEIFEVQRASRASHCPAIGAIR